MNSNLRSQLLKNSFDSIFAGSHGIGKSKQHQQTPTGTNNDEIWITLHLHFYAPNLISLKLALHFTKRQDWNTHSKDFISFQRFDKYLFFGWYFAAVLKLLLYRLCLIFELCGWLKTKHPNKREREQSANRTFQHILQAKCERVTFKCLSCTFQSFSDHFSIVKCI